MRGAGRIEGGSRLVALAMVFVSAASLAYGGDRALREPGAQIAGAGGAASLVLRSLSIAPGGRIGPSQVYDGTGCRGGNVSPGLSWSGAPPGTRSFAVLMFDLDAPGGGWWHWAVFDIPAGARALPAGAGDPGGRLLPPGAIQARNDFGALGYGGPCPPPGAPHRYRLTLYALRIPKLGLAAGAMAAQVDARVRASAIAQAHIVGLYSR